MPELLIRLKKKTDGAAALSCTRADGTVTWQRQVGGHAEFFPLHGFNQYAVETVLGHGRGFFGLLAEGWDISDFSNEWPRGRIPADAEPSELIVGYLDAERHSGVQSNAAEFNAHATEFFARYGVACALGLNDGQLTEIRATMRALFERWQAVPPGGTLELKF